MYDFCILNVPKMDLRAPSLALAQINAIVKDNGLKSTAFDLNILLWIHFSQKNLGKFWKYSDNTFVDTESFNKNKKLITPILDTILFKFIPETKVIGISLFSIFSFVPLEEILKIIKKYNPYSKILLGGPGISIRNKKECKIKYCIYIITKSGQLNPIKKLNENI